MAEDDAAPPPEGGEQKPQLNELEEKEVAERSAPESRIVHAAVAKQGEDELGRPAGSLFWSGLAAGIAMMTSVVAEGALHTKLPDAPWREAVASLGYSVGFLIVILGRMQLFTEHTTVAILPLAAEPTRRNFGRVARLWALVFVGNVIGAAICAALVVYCRTVSPDTLDGMIAVSAKLLDKSAAEILLQGIPAGFLIASIAWIRTASEGGDFWVIVVLTYTIAIAGFSHVIAGSAESFLLFLTGRASLGWAAFGFILPALIGNIIGGTGLFAALAHAQVKAEI